MARETYEEYLKRGGVSVDPARVRAFANHVRDCPVCSKYGEYAYTGCPEGRRLAREAVRPA